MFTGNNAQQSRLFVSKLTVRATQALIHGVVGSLCLSQYAAVGEIIDISLPFLSWSTDSVSSFLDPQPL